MCEPFWMPDWVWVCDTNPHLQQQSHAFTWLTAIGDVSKACHMTLAKQVLRAEMHP